MIAKLEENLQKLVKLYPLSYPTLEGSECFKVEKIQKDKEKDKREKLVIICAPQANIYDRVTLAYWMTLNSNSLNDLAMRVEATASVGCGQKKCPNNAHYGATPCGPTPIKNYGTLCAHVNFPNVTHVCIEM